jgi:16S rRNA (cytidine1402-2'-O)-methyltransferase
MRDSLSCVVATLYLVSTPIGNLDDLSTRAAETLRSVDRILAEDTRRTRVLVDRVASRAPMVSVHAHNEQERSARILEWLAAGDDLALVTDAGTPLVSDPGGRVVAAVVAAGHRVVPIPGPSAPLAALVGSGLPADRFSFMGFLPRKGADRKADLSRIVASQETVILFESPQRLAPLLAELAAACAPDRRVAVARELTKIHEEFVRGTLAEAAEHFRLHSPRGEVTVVVGPAAPAGDEADLTEAGRDMASRLLAAGQRPSEVARQLAGQLGLARNEAYRIVHDLEGATTEE